jgi:hypothetical protein
MNGEGKRWTVQSDNEDLTVATSVCMLLQVARTTQSNGAPILQQCTGCFKKRFTTLKIYSEDMCSVLNCHNVAKITEFHLQ